MDKRHFLGAAFASSTLPAVAAAPSAAGGPALLTITGDVKRSNRGPLDPVRDQMMCKQKLAFTRAFALDFAAIAALPAQTIRPTLEYDADRVPEMAARPVKERFGACPWALYHIEVRA